MDRVLLLVVFTTSIVALVNGYSPNLKYGQKYDEENSEEDGPYVWQDLVDDVKNERREASDDDDSWTGRWLPSRPGDPTPPPKILHKTEIFRDKDVKDKWQHVKMGVQSSHCDNGKTNLRIDWDQSPVNYTCYDKKITPSYSTRPLIYCEHIPSSYVPIHKCFPATIEYNDDIPMYGSHRPVWPTYGEYKFIPKQRWIHSLEHGAIVMLYHPCANPMEVNRLKKLVTGCLRRHIITPYTLLDEERPLALVSWGCRLTMSYVNPSVVQGFIRAKALRGPEPIARHGAFNEYLEKISKVVTDEEDTTLCPGM